MSSVTETTSAANQPSGLKSPGNISTASTVVGEEPVKIPGSTPEVSKKPKKRQNRNKKQKEEKQQKDEESVDVEAEAEPEPEVEEDKYPADLQALIDSLQPTVEEALPIDPVAEFLGKRIRNLQKRKLRIDKIAEIAETQKLNADQIAALENRDYVEGLLKELTEALEVNKNERQKVKEAEAAKNAALISSFKEVLVQAKELGINQGQEKISTLLKFLRAASIKRQQASLDLSVTPQSAGFEALLQLVYNGDDSSLVAVNNLCDGVDELVAEDTVSYKAILDISRLPEDVLLAGGDVETQTEEAAENEGSTDEGSGAESKQTAETSTQSTVKISFLQESELDEDSTSVPDSSAPATATIEQPVEPTEPEPTPTEIAEPASEPQSATESTSDVPASTASPTPEKAQRKKKNYYYRRNRNGNTKPKE